MRPYFWQNSVGLPVIKMGRIRVSIWNKWQSFHYETDLHYKRLEMGFFSIVYRGVSK